MKIRLTGAALPAEILDILDESEAAGAREGSAREDTFAIYAIGEKGPIFYAVLGKDKGGIVSAYYVRSFVAGIGPMIAKQLFGAARVTGQPIRVHADTLARAQALARVAGAQLVAEGVDAEGVGVGVFA